MKIFLGLGLAAAVFLASSAGAAEIPHKFRILDIKIPGQAWPRAALVDINKWGKVLAHTPMLNGDTVSILSDGKTSHKPFGCKKEAGETLSYTYATALNDKNYSVGNCYLWNPTTESYRTIAFLATPTGRIVDLTSLNVAYQAFSFLQPQGMSPGSQYITGNFYNGVDSFPHCFLIDRVAGSFTDIAFPSPIPTADVNSNCVGVNKFGQVLGEYVANDLATNESLEHGFFLWDKGVFSIPLPLSHDIDGGPYTIAYDIEGDTDALLGLYNGNDGTGYAVFFFDDGVSYGIAEPANWAVNDLGGMSTRGTFVGNVTIFKGLDKFCMEVVGDPDYCAIEESHGFVATPAPIKVASK